MEPVTEHMAKKWLVLGTSPVFRARLGIVGLGACRYQLINSQMFYTLPHKDRLHTSRHNLLHLFERKKLVINPPEG